MQSNFQDKGEKATIHTKYGRSMIGNYNIGLVSFSGYEKGTRCKEIC